MSNEVEILLKQRKLEIEKTVERNGQKQSRVYDPNADLILIEVLKELKKMNQYLSLIADEEIGD